MQSTPERRCAAAVLRVGLALAIAASFAGGVGLARACDIPDRFDLRLDGDSLLTIITDPATEATSPEVGFGTIGRWFADLFFPRLAGVDVPINLYEPDRIRSASERAALRQSRFAYYFIACPEGDSGSYRTRLATVTLNRGEDRAVLLNEFAGGTGPSLSFGSTVPLDGLEASTVLRGSLAGLP